MKAQNLPGLLPEVHLYFGRNVYQLVYKDRRF